MSGRDGLRGRLAAAITDQRVRTAVHLATWRKVADRAASMDALPHFEEIRARAAQIRRHTLERLPEYLGRFVERVTALGATVHFAPDAAAACQTIIEIAAARGLKLAVKSKSMTTEEVHLNDALLGAGVRVVETDLGEFIVQIDHDRPSHIITPIIHKDRRQVAQAMTRAPAASTPGPNGDDEDRAAAPARHLPALRSGHHRRELRDRRDRSLCLLTNEGKRSHDHNAPRVHVALLGSRRSSRGCVTCPCF
jgi:L-lactate dehydrogenase complex protein LldF